MSVGKLIDKMADIDHDIGVLEAAIKRLKKTRAATGEKLMVRLKKQGLEKASGRLAHACVRITPRPTIKDPSRFNAYVLKHKALDLFQRRINAKAYFDRQEAAQAPIPGVEVFEQRTIKITKKRG